MQLNEWKEKVTGFSVIASLCARRLVSRVFFYDLFGFIVPTAFFSLVLVERKLL